jgi:hypothetical protein
MMLRVIAVVIAGMIGAMNDHSEARPTQAGQTSKSVINADIVAMTAAKLSDDVIVNAVQQAATTDFDLSPGALIALRNGGVSDRVIQAMQTRAKTLASSAESVGSGPLILRGCVLAFF